MATPTVLVVDDDKLTRFSLSKILGRVGYQVQEAGSAAEGMAAIEGEPRTWCSWTSAYPIETGLPSYRQSTRRIRDFRSS